jgi:hypothetical protein
MAYFGNDGPAQDSGFLSGVDRGAQRLQVARSKRLRHANLGGFGEIEEAKQGTLSQWNEERKEDGLIYATYNAIEEDHDSEALRAAAIAYDDARRIYIAAKAALVNAPEGDAAQLEVLQTSYESAKTNMFLKQQELDLVISGGPHVREIKVWKLTTGTVIAGALAAWWVYRSRRTRVRNISGTKSAMYATFS